MKFATKQIEWNNEKVDPTSGAVIGKREFTIQVREPENMDDLITLCGSLDRVCDIVTQKLLNYANPSKKKFEDAVDTASADLVIQQVIDNGSKVDLTSTRGTGATALLKEHARLKGILEDAGASREDKIGALAAMGFNL